MDGFSKHGRFQFEEDREKKMEKKRKTTQIIGGQTCSAHRPGRSADVARKGGVERSILFPAVAFLSRPFSVAAAAATTSVASSTSSSSSPFGPLVLKGRCLF